MIPIPKAKEMKKKEKEKEKRCTPDAVADPYLNTTPYLQLALEKIVSDQGGIDKCELKTKRKNT